MRLAPLPAACLLAFALACKDTPVADGPAATGVRAIVDPARPEHFFDVPFPSDDLLGEDGLPDLTGFPVAGTPLAMQLVDGWLRRLEQTAVGFSNHGAAYFRFEGHLELPAQTDGLPDDPVLLIDLDTGALTPLELRFIDDPKDDPYFAPHTLALAPRLGHPPRSGATLAAVVMQSAGAAPAAGSALPAGLNAALTRAGVSGSPAVATVFTIQDAVGQLQALDTDARARLGADPDWGEITLRQVLRLEYRQGLTPSGNEGTAQIVTYADGDVATTWMAPQDPSLDLVLDLDESWPMQVFEAQVPLLNYSGLDDRPYMSPGLGHIQDFDRMTGWIDFDRSGLLSEPDVESVRVTVSIPRAPGGGLASDLPVLLWDHGTGGSAYNFIQRRSRLDDGRALTQAMAETGFAMVSRDSPLYGARYPLIDEGYGASLGFYNIVNLPAFRDNQRQAALEGEQLRLFIETGLPALLPAGTLNTDRVRRGGHSLGSVTANLGMSIHPDSWEAAFVSGSGGLLTHYFLDTGLLETIDPALISSLFGLFGAQEPETLSTAAILGAALDLPEPAWAQIDRLHPVLGLFQWTMDPGDPMTVAPAIDLPVHVFVGVGDYQVPNFTTDGLVEALPDADRFDCQPRSDYDPHLCLHREVEGPADLRAWLEAPGR